MAPLVQRDNWPSNRIQNIADPARLESLDEGFETRYCGGHEGVGQEELLVDNVWDEGGAGGGGVLGLSEEVEC